MDPIGLKPVPRIDLEPKKSEHEAPHGAVFQPRFDLNAQDGQRRTTRERAELAGDLPPEVMAALLVDEVVQVVRFEHAGVRDGLVVVIAHVVSARLSDLCSEAAEARKQRTEGSKLAAPAQIEVELQAQDATRGRAMIRVESSALGPMTIELRLERGRVDLHATVSSAESAEALSADQALLERALRLQGVELGALCIEIERPRNAGRARAHKAKRPRQGRPDEGGPAGEPERDREHEQSDEED